MNIAMIASPSSLYWLIDCVAEKWHFYFVKNYLYTDSGIDRTTSFGWGLEGAATCANMVPFEEIAFPFALFAHFAKLCSINRG